MFILLDGSCSSRANMEGEEEGERGQVMSHRCPILLVWLIC